MSAKDVLAEALRLPTKERGRLVHELIESLDSTDADDAAEEVEKAWAVELQGRAERALKGESTGRDLDVVCGELDAKRRPSR